jgi:hypothetical protein
MAEGQETASGRFQTTNTCSRAFRAPLLTVPKI